MGPKRKATKRKNSSRSPSTEPQPPLEPTVVEERPPLPEPQTQNDAEDIERYVDKAASERDSSISGSEVSDDGEATATTKTPAASHKTRKPKTKMVRSLTNEEEDEVLEWLKANRFLYDKSSFEFKNRQKKDRTWLEMEQTMRLNPGDLSRWYTSLRTQYVKEVKKRENVARSGAGAVDDIVTPRNTWLLEKFEFVKPYVCQSRATKGSKIQQRDRHSDCSDSSTPPPNTCEGKQRSATTSTASSTISDYLDKVTQQLAVPKSDIQKTCDFIGTLMAKMTPSYLDDYTSEAICRAMEYVKLSKQERRQGQQTPNVNILQQTQPSFTEQLQTASQPAAMQYNPLPAAPQLAVANKLRPKTITAESRQSRMTTDYIMARNLASSNPPSDVLQQHGRYQWTEIQPGNLQPVFPGQLQPIAYSTQVLSGSQPPNTATSTETATLLTDVYDTMVPDPSFN